MKPVVYLMRNVQCVVASLAGAAASGMSQCRRLPKLPLCALSRLPLSEFGLLLRFSTGLHRIIMGLEVTPCQIAPDCVSRDTGCDARLQLPRIVVEHGFGHGWTCDSCRACCVPTGDLHAITLAWYVRGGRPMQVRCHRQERSEWNIIVLHDKGGICCWRLISTSLMHPHGFGPRSPEGRWHRIHGSITHMCRGVVAVPVEIHRLAASMTAKGHALPH